MSAHVCSDAVHASRLSRCIHFALALGIASALTSLSASANEAAAAPPAEAATDSVQAMDAVEVTAHYGYQPVEVKKDAIQLVDSAVYDDIEAPTGDNSIASMLVQLPGISAEEDGDEPRYITIRGISADLNTTTLDGITLATVGENGSGARRANLQLIPSDLSSRTDVSKTFTAEQDGGAIGGVIDIVSRSAMDHAEPYFMADAYGIYSTFDGPRGVNTIGSSKSHWGKGLKTVFANRFGADGQFGLVFSGRYQDRVRNAAKRWTDQKNYFDQDGLRINGPDEEQGWNGMVASNNHSYAAYSNFITNKGASAKLEWTPSLPLYGSVLAYSYQREETSNFNANDINLRNEYVLEQTPDSGRAQVYSLYTKHRYNQWDRKNSGLLTRLDWQGEDSLLSFRAGYSREQYEDHEPYVQARAYPRSEFLDYYNEPFPGVASLDNPAFLLDSQYKLSSANVTDNQAEENVLDARLDFSRNIDPQDTGFGFRSGVEWRRLRIGKNVDSTRYATGRVMDDYLFDPGYVQHGAKYPQPWIDHNAFWGAPDLKLNPSATEYYSRNADYDYTEKLRTGYVSLHYATDRTRYILGLRSDQVDFDAHTPVIEDGVALAQKGAVDGGYDQLLPSFNVLHRIGDGINLRFSYSRTLGRPTPGDIAQAESVTCGEDEDLGPGCSISRGNPELKPRRADNYDVAFERYFNGNNGLLSLAYFEKRIADDIFTLTTEEQIGDTLYRIRQPLNAEESSIRGLELSAVNRRFSFLPGALANLGASFNATYMDGEMNYSSDAGSRKLDRLLYQPRWIGNATLTYGIPAIRGTARLSANYRGKYLSSIGASPWLDKGRDELTTVDLSFWHRVGSKLVLKYEIDNLLHSRPKYVVGNDLQYLGQRDEYGQGFYFHAIYEL